MRACLLISKLQPAPQKNALTKALQEYGRLNETIFILKYLQSPEYQKKITVQLNQGEALRALRRDIFIANEGRIRKRHHEDQLNQAACLNLVVNAVTIWNTVYMQAVKLLDYGGVGFLVLAFTFFEVTAHFTDRADEQKRADKKLGIEKFIKNNRREN